RTWYWTPRAVAAPPAPDDGNRFLLAFTSALASSYLYFKLFRFFSAVRDTDDDASTDLANRLWRSCVCEYSSEPDSESSAREGDASAIERAQRTLKRPDSRACRSD